MHWKQTFIVEMQGWVAPAEKLNNCGFIFRPAPSQIATSCQDSFHIGVSVVQLLTLLKS